MLVYLNWYYVRKLWSSLVTLSALMDSEVLLAVFGTHPVLLVALHFT